jgi:hypothetical protein
MRSLSNELWLQPPSAAAGKLERLTLAWELIAVGEFQTLEFERFEPGAVRRAPGVEVTVERSEQVGDRWEVTLRIARDLAVPEPEELLFVENELALFDSHGREFQVSEPVGTLTSRGARVTWAFTPPQSNESERERTPQSLRFRYPTLRAQREVEFHFRGVPLPRSRPQ